MPEVPTHKGLVSTITTYECPPVRQRSFIVHHDAEPESFFAKIEEVKEAIAVLLPVYDPQHEWRLNLPEKNGVPQFESMKHEMRVTHWFWNTKDRTQARIGCNISLEQFAVVLTTPSTAKERFPYLNDWCNQLVTVWGEILQPKVRGVMLEYVNILNRNSAPGFVTAEGSLQISELLTVFAGFPGAHQGIIPPYDCKMGLVIDRDLPLFLNLQVAGELQTDKTGASQVKVLLQAFRPTTKGTPALTTKEALASIGVLHQAVIDKFNVTFTTKAKQAFKPKP